MALTVSNVTYSGLSGTMMQMKGVNDAASAASSIGCGFTPRYIEVYNLTDGITDRYFPDNTAGTSFHQVNAGTTTVAAANGVTILPDIAAVATVVATGSPRTSGPGFSLGTGILLASKTYQINIWS